MSVDRKAMLGHKIRRFRQEQGLNQTEMAEQLGISASYLNLIERNQRPVTVPLLFRLGQAFEIDLKAFAEDDEARLATGLKEVFGDPLFVSQPVKAADIRELATASPDAAQAVLTLYKAYRALREDAQALANRLTDGDRPQSLDVESFPVEEVRDAYQARANHFPEIEAAAEQLWQDAGLDSAELYAGLVDHLEQARGIGVRIMPVDVMQDTLRRFDHHRRRVLLSEALPPSGRRFQLAVQEALLGHGALLDGLVAKAGLSGPAADRLFRFGLANYFAGAVLMPYERFLAAARELRYDIEVLQHRFGASFEQVCHRFTTLQRPGARGVPFFFIRVDNAGNVSKRLSGGGFQFARFGGTCPRWIVHDVFRAPGVIHTQIAEMPDGTTFLTIARTAEAISTGFRTPQQQLAIAVGCEVGQARQLVYGDGMDLKNRAAATPIGVSCRVCERLDCNQRAHPPLNLRLKLDENMRRVSPFTFAAPGR